MALVDWRVLSASEFIGRIAQDATPREQARTFMQVCGIIRSEGLTAIILDMDHAVAHMSEEAGDFGSAVLAEEMAASGLERFALVNRAYEGSWWDGLVAELSRVGVAARSFETVAAAKDWLPAPETKASSEAKASS